MEEVESNVQAEVVPEQTENHEAEKQNSNVETQVIDRQEKNFRAMRKRQDELEQKLKEKDEMVERLLQMQMSNQSSPKQEIDELEQISDEEYIPKGKQKKLVKKEVEPLLKEIDDLKKQVQAQKQVQHIDSLRRKYSDFDEIVNSETLSLLEEQDPELAQTIADIKDPYKMGIQSYKFIKAMNLEQKAPQARRSKEAEKKIEQNAKTVQSPQAYDKRPLAQAFQITKSEKTALYKEMMGYASQAGFSY